MAIVSATDRISPGTSSGSPDSSSTTHASSSPRCNAQAKRKAPDVVRIGSTAATGPPCRAACPAAATMRSSSIPARVAERSYAGRSRTMGYTRYVTQTKQRTRPDVLEEVVAWRREQLERGGYEAELADQIARSDADLHQAVRLLKQGCTPEIAAQILL